MVLQTYFHNLDNSYNKLQTINEYMDDVEVTHRAADSPSVSSSFLCISLLLCTAQLKVMSTWQFVCDFSPLVTTTR